MLIGELADRTGASRRLLRYYEEQGLLQPVRGANGYREYADSDLERVGHIRNLLAAGLPTVRIAGLLECISGDPDQPTLSGCPTQVEQLRAERARVTAALAQLEQSGQVLDVLLEAAANGPHGAVRTPGVAGTA